MNTKTAFVSLLMLFYGFETLAQYTIVGPDEVCVGSCEEYYLLDDNGDVVDLISGEWQVDGNAVSNASLASICFANENVYIVSVIDQQNDIFAVVEVEAFETFQPEIITVSGAYCPGESIPGGTTTCQQVCANTTITYAVEVGNPSQNINWTVQGAEDYTISGNAVTVTWGDPGNGSVSVEVSSQGVGFDIYCGMFQEASNGASDGGGFVFIDGPIDDYSITLSNGIAASGNGGTFTFTDLSPGPYTAWVTNSFGVTEICQFVITDFGTACIFGIAFEVVDASECENCDGSINPIVVGGTAPFTYQWSGPAGYSSNVQTLDNLCPGIYFVTIWDAEGCSATATALVECGNNSCGGENSVCVEILENPEAAFETTPPANNGVVEICAGQTVFFENQTTGAVNYTWDFGNGVSASTVNTNHTYLSPGSYEVLLIARNNCYCADTTSMTVIVEDAISPYIECAGTVCSDSEATYSTNADCSIFNWNVGPNGTIIGGGGTSDNFITVDWGAGQEGLIELFVDGCNGDYCLETISEIIPIIDDNAVIKGPSKVCKSDQAIYSLTGFTGTDFNWSVSNFGAIETGQGTSQVTVSWPDFIPAQQQWVAVQYESCYLGCGGNDTLLVNILEDFFIEGPIEVCLNETVDFVSRTPALSNNAVPSNWTVLDDTGATVATSASATSVFSVNWNFGSGNFTIHAEADNPDDYCVDNYSVFVRVPAATSPALGIDGITTICPGQAYAYTAIESGPDFQFTWYVINGVSNEIRNGKTINITWEPNPPYTLALTQTNTVGFACESEPVGIGLQKINSVMVDGLTPVCHEAIGVYTATAYERVEYQWQVIPSDAATVISGGNSNEVEIQWHIPGNFEVVANVCGVSDGFQVLVNPKPDPEVIFDLPCPGDQTQVQTTIPYNAYEWRNQAGIVLANTPTANLASGSYELIVTDANGCTKNKIFTVGQLSPPVTSVSTPDFGTFCQSGGSMTLYSLLMSNGLDYQWYHNGNPVGGNSPILVVSQEGVYYVVVTTPDGCSTTSNALELDCGTIPPIPNPACTPNGFVDFVNDPGIYCNETQFINTSVNDVPGTWWWKFIDFGTGVETISFQENPTHTFQTAGFHFVIFQAGVFSTPPGDTCFMNVLQTDTVPLVANFSFTSGCAGELLPFYDISNFIPQTSITGWEWDFGDPASGAANVSTLQNPEHAFSAAGTFTVTLTATDESGCISTIQKNITVQPAPLSGFDIPDSGCESTTLHFSAQGSFTTINWDFGDPASGAANVSAIDSTYHVFGSPGIYTVTLTTENIFGCASVVTEQIDIQSNDLSGVIAIDPASTICHGDSVTLTAPAASTYLWSEGDTTMSLVLHEAGVHSVMITDDLGCLFSTDPVQVDVIPLPEAQITAIEYNEHGQPVANFYNNYETCYGEDVYLQITENINYTYEWSTTDVGTHITFTEDKDNLLSVGTHVFSVTVTDVSSGCSNVIGPYSVTVHPVPENILIDSDPPVPVCENTPTDFEVVNPNVTYTYIWNTGQTGNTINSFYAGEYFVRAINEFGCQGRSNILEITAGPNIDLIPSGCYSRCNPDTICLPDLSGVVSFQWYHDGNPVPAPEGTVGDYVATQSGEYYVEMTNAEGCLTTSDVLSLDLLDGYGSILGNVYFDMNDNGIIDGPDTLMGGIVIILQNGGLNIDTLISNPAGAFAFSNILAGDYEVLLDLLNLPLGMYPVVEQFSSSLVGCDDEATLSFLIQFTCDVTVETVDLEACPGTTVNYNGDELAVGSETSYVFTGSNGCDSIITVEVNALPIFTSSLELSACDGDYATYAGVQIPAGSSQDFTLTATNGCDSTVTVDVIPISLSETEVNLSACEGTTVEYNGEDLPPGSITEFTFLSSQNCDSTVTVFVETLYNSDFDLNLSACENETVIYNGQPLQPGSTSTFTFTNSVGCDSLVTVAVSSIPVIEVFIDLFACPGETVEFQGDILAPGASTDYLFTSSLGCDSVVQVSVSAFPDFNFELATTESCWNDSGGSVIVDEPVGGAAPFLYALDGTSYQSENEFYNLVPGDYEVFVKDENDCVNSLPATVESIAPMVIVAESPRIPCVYGSTLLEVQVIADDPEAVTYLWPDGSENSFLEVDEAGVYSVVISNTCETVAYDFNVEFEDDSRSSLFFIPNVFSPNGDGVNDEFRVYTAQDIEILHFELNIFDRWGNHLKSFESTEDSWDGLFNEKAMNPGVYVWYYKVTAIACGKTIDLFAKGDVTLVK